MDSYLNRQKALERESEAMKSRILDLEERLDYILEHDSPEYYEGPETYTDNHNPEEGYPEFPESMEDFCMFADGVNWLAEKFPQYSGLKDASDRVYGVLNDRYRE